MLVTVVVFLTGTVGFLLSTGGGVVFVVLSSIFSMLLRNSLGAAPIADEVAELLLFEDVIFVTIFVSWCCCCTCICCFLRARRDATSDALDVKSKFLFSKDLRWAATLPVGKPVSDRISLSESREPKLSLRFDDWVDEELPDFLISVLTVDDVVPKLLVVVAELEVVVVRFEVLAVLWLCWGCDCCVSFKGETVK